MADADRNRVIVLAIVEGGLTVAEAARRFGVTRQWIHRLLARYRTDGLEGLEPRSRTAHLLEPPVAARLRGRFSHSRDPSELAVGSPTDPTRVREARNATKAVAPIYK